MFMDKDGSSFVERGIPVKYKIKGFPRQRELSPSVTTVTEGLLYVHFEESMNQSFTQTIPPPRLRRATSFCTKEAFKVWWSFRRSTPFFWGSLFVCANLEVLLL